MNNNYHDYQGRKTLREDVVPSNILGVPELERPLAVNDVPSWARMTLMHPRSKAPRPIPLTCFPPYADTPPMYSTEYFGPMTHTEADKKLVVSGSYLVRQSGVHNKFYALSLRFMGSNLHFKLYYDTESGKHYVKSKRFDTVQDLVADGLFTLYMDIFPDTYNEMVSTPNQDRVKKAAFDSKVYALANKRKLEEIASQAKANQVQLPTQSMSLSQGQDHKNHHFKTISLKGLNWCDFCASFMWGFLQQGLKCEDCGFISHTKCADKVPADCTLPAVNMKACFKIDLTTMARYHTDNIPWIVKKCIGEIEKRGMQSEGLYRVSGFAEEIDSLKLAIDKCGIDADMGPEVYENINVVTGVLKMYFRTLPKPLINSETLKALIADLGLENEIEQVDRFRSSLTILPEANYFTLKYLIEHLSRVASKQAINKMGVNNIATVFCPSLMPLPTVAVGGSLPDMSKEIEILAFLISMNDLLFIY